MIDIVESRNYITCCTSLRIFFELMKYLFPLCDSLAWSKKETETACANRCIKYWRLVYAVYFPEDVLGA